MTIPVLDRRHFLAGAGISLASLRSAPSFAQAAAGETPRRGGTLRFATLGLDTSDFHRHTGSIGVPQVVVEALTSIADDGSVKPFLAESYAVAPDGLSYTFKIRPNVMLHNGRALTAEDVRANFQRVKERVSGGWLASAMKQVASLEAPAPDTFVVRMLKPYAPFLGLISELWIVAPESPGWNETISLPIGTGPFKFGRWTPKVEFMAPRHDSYWQRGLPYLDAVRFDLRGDEQNDLALRSGDLHAARVAQDKAGELLRIPGMQIKPLKDTSWYSWSFNNRRRRPPFDRVRVREAVATAIDKPGLMQFLAGDRGVVSNQMVAPGNFYWDKALQEADPHAKPDLARGRRILREEGVDPAGVTMRVVSWQTAFAEASVQAVKELGFKVEHIALDDLGAQRRLGEYDWDLAPFSSGPRADIFLRYVRLMSDGPNPVLWGGIQDPALDKAILAAVAEVDDQKRRALYLDAWKIVTDRYYVVVIGHLSDLFGARPEVRGFDGGFTWSPHRVDGGLAFTWLAAQA